MDGKKTLATVVLALAIAATPGLSQQNQQEKLNFTLSKQKHKTSYLSKENSPQMQSYIKMQECLRRMGEDYTIMIAPGDNMPIIVPDITKYPMPIVKPGPEWYRDDKFIIKPDLKWRLPDGWLKKDFYGKPSQGILIYDSNRKRI
jgi:hypothetical protein